MLISRKVDKVFFLLAVLLILLPKVNLVSFSGQTAGLRIDDFIISFFLLLFFMFFLEKKSVTNFDGYIYFIFFSFLSLVVCYSFGFLGGNLLYPIRLVEYLFFYVVGYYCISENYINKYLFFIFILNAFVMVLQYAGFVGGFASEGYNQEVSSRVIGLTGGPWEIGFLINIIFCYVGFNSSLSRKNVFLFFCISFVFVLLTGARMPTVTHLILIGVYLIRFSRNKVLAILVTFILVFALSLLLFFVDNPVSERSIKLFSMDNLHLLFDLYDTVKISPQFYDFPSISVNKESDLSWLIRSSKWIYAIKQWMSSPITILFGVGPGFWGPALDGGWLRVLTENGVIGFLLFTYSLVKFYSNNLVCKIMFLAFFINMIMIDLYLSYKSMALFLLCMGYFKAVKNRSYKNI